MIAIRMGFFVFQVLIMVCNNLHLFRHSSTSINLPYLQSIRSQISQGIDLVRQNQVNNDNGIAKTSSVDQKITVLQKYLLLQRKVLLDIYSKSQFNLNETAGTCPIMIGEDRQKIIAFSNNFSQVINNLSVQPNNIANNELLSLINQVKQINPFVNQNNPIYGQQNQVQPSSFKTLRTSNINFGSWVLGNQSNQTVVSTIAGAGDGNYLEMCPLNSPFFSSGNCLECPASAPYFLLQNSTCIFCSDYNSSTRQCYDKNKNIIMGKLYFTNYNAASNRTILSQNQSLAQFTDNSLNLEVCHDVKPFFNGAYCMDCPDGLYFSPSEKNCQTCPVGKFYNPDTQKCEIQLYYSNLGDFNWQTNSKSIDDIIESISIQRSNLSFASCPKEAPFSNQTACINCGKDTHFSYDSLSCIQCPPQTKLDSNMHKCLKPGNLNFQTNPINASNLIYNGRLPNQWINIYYQNRQKYSGISDCPSLTPFFDGLACISCPASHPYFNLQSKICQNCQGITLYDQDQHQCLSNDQRAIQKATWQKMAAGIFT